MHKPIRKIPRRRKFHSQRRFLQRFLSNKDLLLKLILGVLALGLGVVSFIYGKKILSHENYLIYRNTPLSPKKNILERLRPEESKEPYADGIHKTYYPSGALESVYEIKNGQYEGIWNFYSEYGVLLKEESYQNGKIHGLSKFYYETGELLGEVSYELGEVISMIKYDKQKKILLGSVDI